jgi:hypothetical protein
MRLQRPGDLLRYWWLKEHEFGVELLDHVRRNMKFIDRQAFQTTTRPTAQRAPTATLTVPRG